MNGWEDIVLEHAVPTVFLAVALVLAFVTVIISTVRMLSLDRLGATLLVIRLVWLSLLGWCLFMPAQREAMREEVRPRWIVLLDVSASMTNAAAAQGPAWGPPHLSHRS